MLDRKFAWLTSCARPFYSHDPFSNSVLINHMMKLSKFSSPNPGVFLILGLIVSITVFFIASQSGLAFPPAFTLAITALCAVWWVSEPIPLAITSLIPIALFPLLGILSKQEVAQSYGHSLILLLLGGFILSTAMESSGTHRRLAIGMVNLFGAHNSRRLVLGFLFASAMLSMWISNTATTLMLLPIALAILSGIKERDIDAPLLLGIGYAASLGGIGTPIGTPPNLIFQQVYSDTTGTEVDFLTWMSWGVPVVLLFLPIMGLWLTRHAKRSIDVELPSVGKLTSYEKRVLLVFAITALAWIFRSQPFGGWSQLLGLPQANDASTALLAVVLMFVIPRESGSKEKLLTWEVARTIPWRVLLLFAGGITLASAFKTTGLSVMIGDQLSLFTALPIIIVIALLCLAITFLTEITSNTATTSLLMPILAAAALSAKIPPEIPMAPAAMSASCAFMLPAATAPNAVVYSSDRVTIRQMAKNGLVLNLIGVVVITGISYALMT